MDAKAVSRSGWKIGDMLVEDAKDPVFERDATFYSRIVEDAEVDCAGASRPQRHIRAAVAVRRDAQRIGITR
jgi:hypothetical protein